ncbi:MATE family efflux transporter [Catenovulum sp. SM1970]|uniref:MATE family efflux transporter n=1 Tax=Marinifaba aquimaris TaxID=2741323 RepID=UPI0015732629|nr:MATE family efflux transporter [Marinifaba aquimaris]NTS78833.1 MATE family efflux transporter [Marinifaba aquimaris]
MSQNNPALSGKVIPTFFYYVLPSIIGLVAITTANLVDGFFVGNYVGADALASITLMVPYFTLLIATALMIAIGGAVSAGKAMGEDNVKKASDIFSQSLIASIVINATFAFLSLFFVDELFGLLSMPEQIHPMAKEYLDVIRWVFILQLTTMVLYYFVRPDSHPILATTALVTGAVLNIILDYWFIVELDYGLAGAAYATAIAQVIQFLVLSYYFFSPKRALKFTWLNHNWALLKQSAFNGVSEFINEMSVGIIFFILNGLMIHRLGVDGVAAFTLVNYFIFLSIMLSYGLADALHLVVSQNFGAKQHIRVKQFLSIAVMTVLSMGLVIVSTLLIWPNAVLGSFVSSNEQTVLEVSYQLLPLILPLFLINGTNIVLTCYLTAIHQPKPSALIATARSLVLPATLLLAFYLWLPDLNFLSPTSNDFAFIIALPLAEWCAFFVALYFVFAHRPTRLNQLKAN